jgi:hypothetical protein
MLTFGALKYICDQHIRQCQSVARQLALPAPGARDLPMAERVDT